MPAGNGRRRAALGERARRAARLPAGRLGRGAGLSEGVRDPGGGWARRGWAPCVYVSARVTSAEKRTELPRRGRGGGPAPEEARPGRVCGRREAAAGAGAGRRARGGTWEAPGAPGGWGGGVPDTSFPSPSGLIAGAYLCLPQLLACTTGCTRPFFYSRSPCRPPAARLPLFPGGRGVGVGREGRLALIGICVLNNKTETGWATRTSSVTALLVDPFVAQLALGDRAAGGCEGARGGQPGLAPGSASRAAGPPRLLHWGILIRARRGQRKCSPAPRGIQIAVF